jgi:hypothetical protein
VCVCVSFFPQVQEMDSSVLYAMIFGSEKFEELIGETKAVRY